MATRPYRRILACPMGTFFLHGVRGVGKSTWARGTFPDALVVDLLDESRYQALVANPALLGLELRTLPVDRIVYLGDRHEDRGRDRCLAARSLRRGRGRSRTLAMSAEIRDA